MRIIEPVLPKFKFPSSKLIGIYCRVCSKHDAVLFKSYSAVDLSPVKRRKRKDDNGEVDRYMCISSQPAIIPKETFESVQAEKVRKGNVEITAEDTKRKSFDTVKEGCAFLLNYCCYIWSGN